ncbi:MAG: DUF1801 domain-containing protein, partial [Saccharofermentanales bacterium]
EKLQDWFIERYVEETGKKPDMGKSCIRFKKTDMIPLRLIGELVSKVTAEEWAEVYKEMREKSKKC